ncbi:MAG: LuxR C-terminal-related transcriptional regulator [Polyangiaceae bacterium]
MAFGTDELVELRRAAWLHDIGRLSVPNRIWDAPGALSFGDWERVRLHGYYTERVIAGVPHLARAGRIAAQAHERLDASGYHAGRDATALSRAARLLAVADAARAMSEPRPHRAARSLPQIQNELAHDVRLDKLDGPSVDAVLAALGATPAHPPPAAPAHGLSARELEVLTLLARGKTNKEIAALLGISARTVQNHVAHIYDKIGAYSRAGAAVWLMEQGLAK